MTLPHYRRAWLTAVAAASTLALVACTAEDPADAPLPSVSVEALDVPEGMLATKPHVDLVGGILASTDTLPYAVGGALSEPGEGGRPTVWLSTDGRSWEATDIDPDMEGSFGGRIAGTEALTALVGTIWHDGALTSAVWTSEDRSTWKRAELPSDFAASIRITAATVDDEERLLLVGMDYERNSRGIIVDGDEVTEMSLPEPAEGEDLDPIDLEFGGGATLLLATPGPEGELSPLLAYRSSDGGETWEPSPSEVTDERSGAYGAVWSGDRFVATGYAPANNTPAAPYTPAAWSSPDGVAWTAEAVPPASESEYYATPTSNVWLGEPSVAGGIVSTIGANQNQAYSAGYERSPNGEWRVLGYTSFNDGNGRSGLAISSGDGSTAGFVGNAGAVRAGTFSGGNWTDGAVLSERENLFWAQDIVEQAEGALVTLSRSDFTVAPDGVWRNSSSSAIAQYDGTGVTTTTATPARVGELSRIIRASDPDAGEVVIGTTFPPGSSTILAEGYFRASADGEWMPMSGFPSEGATSLASVKHTDNGWLAVGSYRTDTVVSTPEHGVIWSSADGITWTPELGYFGSGELETVIEDACQLPDGTSIAIGYTEVRRGDYRAASWVLEDGTWTRGEIGDYGDRRGWFSSCADSTDGLVAAASFGGRDVLLRTEDGASWQAVFEAEDGVSMGSPVAVPGGFAAPGGWSNSERSGAVVWVSKDGSDWTPLAVPSHRPGSTGLVAPVGDDLVIAMSASTGHPLLVVRDIADVIAEHSK